MHLKLYHDLSLIIITVFIILIINVLYNVHAFIKCPYTIIVFSLKLIELKYFISDLCSLIRWVGENEPGFNCLVGHVLINLQNDTSLVRVCQFVVHNKTAKICSWIVTRSEDPRCYRNRD